MVNLLGPRLSTQRPYDRFWHDTLTFVQLRFAFVDSSTGQPHAIGRTFLTFYE